MTLVQPTELYVGNEHTYEISEPLFVTPESILALEATEALVLARRIDTDTGNLTHMQQPARRVPYPVRPSDERMKDSTVADAHYQAYMDYLEALRVAKAEVRPLVPVPAYVGTVQALGRTAYFALKHIYTPKPTIHIPYDGLGTTRYLVQPAQIVG